MIRTLTLAVSVLALVAGAAAAQEENPFAGDVTLDV